MSAIQKLETFIWRIFHPTASRKVNVLIKYFNDRASNGSVNLKEIANVSSPLPNNLNDYEVVGALILFILTENTPIPILFEKYPIHNTWKKRFVESFFITAEEVAWDLRVKGFTMVSMRLLGYCQRIAAFIGRPELEERFDQRKKSIFRGRHPRWNP